MHADNDNFRSENEMLLKKAKKIIDEYSAKIHENYSLISDELCSLLMKQ